jgi:hypothetical protein
VQLHRVFPHKPSARVGEPGHGLHVRLSQGDGRWDNPDLYRATYLAVPAEGAIGEALAHMATWSAGMLRHPSVPGATRALGLYRFDEEAHPLLDLDDARNLLERGLRPSRVVWKNRPATQSLAAAVHDEGRWAGLTWWSPYRPQWRLVCLWRPDALVLEAVQPLAGHPALVEAAQRMGRLVDPDLR